MAIPRRRTTLGRSIVSYTFRYLFTSKLCEDNVSRFEKKVASFVGVENAVAVPSGRLGLYFILKALELKNGDGVLMASYNYGPLLSVLSDLGLNPQFVDIDKKTLNIDSKDLAKRISSKSKAIIVTHLFGNPCDMDYVNKLAKKHGLYVIEDCAHAFGAKTSRSFVGSLSDASFFSFSSGKILSTFGGGMVLSNDNKLIRKIKGYRVKPTSINFLLFKSMFKEGLIHLLTNRYILHFIFPFWSFFTKKRLVVKKGYFGESFKGDRYSNFQAFVGLNQLQFIDDQLDFRNKVATSYKTRLKGKFEFQVIGLGCYSSYNMFVILTPPQKETHKRLISNFIDNNIDVMHNLPNLVGYGGRFPNTSRIEKMIVQIPIYPQMKKKDIDKILCCLGVD